MDRNLGLRKRGQIVNSDLTIYGGHTRQELIDLLNSNNSIERSCAVHLLGTDFTDDEETARLMLERISVEKALYTRIEISSVLQKGGTKTAEMMTKYLGCIGKNQYKVLPDQSSKKVSYPLQRDIIARILGKMDSKVYPVIKSVLLSDDMKKISEAIDAAGYMIFYNQELATEDNAQFFCGLVEKYKSNELILWKLVTGMSAFSQDCIIEKLETIKEQNSKNIIKKEAERSLMLIYSRQARGERN